MNNKIFILTDFNSAETTIITHKLLIKYLIKEFEKVVFIDISNFILFKKSKKNFLYLKKKYPDIDFISFQNSKDFSFFFKKFKNKISINNFGKRFEDLYIHYLVKKNSIKQFKILNVDVVTQSVVIEKKHFLKKFFHFLNNKVSSFIINILTGLNLLNKIDICFTTNKSIFLNNSQCGFIRKKFLFYKKVILVNSSAYDMCFDNKGNLDNKHILYIDYNLNHTDNLKEGKKQSELEIKQHYSRVNKFLTYLKNLYKKKVIVSIHPQYSLKTTKKFLKNFKIYKNRTFELIKKSEIVTLFNSTSINPAFIMKKKIIYLSTKKVGLKRYNEFNSYPRRSGSLVIDIDDKLDFSKLDLVKKFKKNKKKVDLFTMKYLRINQKKPSYKKIISEIKKYA